MADKHHPLQKDLWRQNLCGVSADLPMEVTEDDFTADRYS